MKKALSIDNAKWLTCPAARKPDTNSTIGFSSGNDYRTVQFAPLPDLGGECMFRRVFSGDGVTACRITGTALGIYELYCNGARVGTKKDDGSLVYDEMKPGWTDYNKRVLSDTYDLTPYLKAGDNLILCVVAPGWFSGRISMNDYGTQPLCFRAALTLEKETGNEVLLTDETWETRFGGRIRTADIWDGEYVDAREPAYEKLSIPGADAAEWAAAGIAEHPDTVISPRVGPQVRVRMGMNVDVARCVIYDGVAYNGSDFGKVHVVSDTAGFSGVTLKRGQTLQLDFGQEIVGRPLFTLCGQTGMHVTFRFGEFLNDSGLLSRGNDNPEGSLYTINYRSAKAKLQYICGSDSAETYCPLFTFFGFRYIEIKAEGDVTFESIRALIIGSEVPETGSLETSSPLVNRLIQNIIWGQRSNYLSIPTDCPQRDERLGWTGDTQIFCRTAAYNGDVRGFFRKWLQDVRDAQQPNGAYPDVIPRLHVVGNGAAAWGDAGIIVPYQMYVMYNDIELVAEHYASMEKYMEYVHENNGPRSAYNDWVAFEPLDGGIIPLAYYGMDATMMATMARALGHNADARKYEAEFNRAKNLFREAYVKSGVLAPTSQCGYLMALKAGFLEEGEIPAAVKTLKDKIISNGYRLSTGFVGTGVLNQTLAECGEDGLAYSLLLQEECPSWLYSVKQGATTMWERWNSYTLADGFGPVSMNSFNHYAYGAVGEWMYRFMCGIETDPNHPGFGHVLLQPRPDLRTDGEMPAGQERITRAAATFQSVNGPIASSWEMKDGAFFYTCSVPVGATLTLPMMGRNAYVMNGERRNYTGDNGSLVLELQPGTYKFEI